jgi:hypothetical protein
MRDRPPIPRTVIDWPIGAGDPATDVPGATRFRVVEVKRTRRRSIALEAIGVGTLFVALLGLAGLQLAAVPHPVVARTPHVDARIVEVKVQPEQPRTAAQGQQSNRQAQRSARG